VQTIGPFQIRKQLGRGVSGVVYESYDPGQGTTGALKVYEHVTSRTPALKSRLLRDAQAAGQLHHPNIARVLAVGEHDGHPYVAMELAEGLDLAQVARARKPFPVEWVLDLWRQLCEGLAHAHRNGLLHLDLKPTDVRVTPGGEVKVVDFGVQHLKSMEPRDPAPAVGGVHYRAPEQVEGRKPDARADVFSAAAIVYELLARRRAFPGDDVTTVFRNITRGRPDPSALPYTAFSPGLEEILLGAMARDPRERPSSFEAVHAELVRLVRETVPRLRPAAPAVPGPRTDEPLPPPRASGAEREQLLTELTRARAEDHMQRGLDICRRLLEIDPEDETARRAAGEIEAVVQDREVEQLVGLALAYAADGDTELATKIAEKVERVAPWSPRYLQLQVYLDEVAARQTVDRLLIAARQAMNYDRVDEARAAAEEALSLLPGHAAALKILEELLPPPVRPDDLEDEAGREAADAAPDAQEAEGGEEAPGPETDPALESAPGEETGPTDAAAEAALLGAEARRTLDSREQQVESLTSAALLHFVGNDHGKARQAVEEALAIDPANHRALQLQKILGALG
jgi:tetratricopeptide (TPR) repeat protein